MKSLRFALSVVLCLGVGVWTAGAQLSVYGTVTGARVGGVTCPGFAVPCAQTDGYVKPYGTNFGAFYDFRTIGPVRVGLDLRGQSLFSNKRADSSLGGRNSVRHNAVLLGVRGSFHSPIKILTPYVEVLGGLDRNNDTGLYTNTTTVLNVTPPVTTTALTYNPDRRANYGLVEGVAGLDLRIGGLISFRVIELGIGDAFGSVTNFQAVTVQQSAGGSTTSQTTASQTSSPSSHLVESLSVGVVFHFGH